MCGLDYMQGILAGRVKVLHNFEICRTRVPYPQTITKKLVIEKVQDNDVIKKYLPTDPNRQASKEWLFDVVATLDPTFFPKLVKEVEASKVKKAGKPESMVEVTPEMLELIEKFQSFSISKTNSRSLAGLGTGRSMKKRNRKEYTRERDFATRFEAREDRVNLTQRAYDEHLGIPRRPFLL